MTRHTPKTVFDEALNDIAGSPVLHDQDFLRLAPALDLFTKEWLRVFMAHSELPSSRRDVFRETLAQQLERLSWNVQNDDPCPENMALATRLAELPQMLKLTVLDAIERFWTSDAGVSSWDEHLQSLGLRPCTSAHDRMAAFAHRRHVLAGSSDPADPAASQAQAADPAAGRSP